MNTNVELYLEEMEELTELMRNASSWADLRECIQNYGFDAQKIVMVSFMETEDEREFGIFINCDEKIYKYERVTAAGLVPKFENLIELPEEPATFKISPAIELAINILRNP